MPTSSRVCLLAEDSVATRIARWLKEDGVPVRGALAVPPGFDGVVVAVHAGGSLPHLPTEALVVDVEEAQQEVVARVASALAGEPRASHQLTLADGFVSPAEQHVVRDEQTVGLTPLEARLVAYLSAHRDRAIPRSELLTQVMGYAPGVRSRAADSCVHRLRHKIERDPVAPERVQLVRGLGYRWRPYRQPQPSEGTQSGAAALRMRGAEGAHGVLAAIAASVGDIGELLDEIAFAVQDLGADHTWEQMASDGGWSLLVGSPAARAWAATVAEHLAAVGPEALATLTDLAVFAAEDGSVSPEALSAAAASLPALNACRSRGLVRRVAVAGGVSWSMVPLLRGLILSHEERCAPSWSRSVDFHRERARRLGPVRWGREAHQDLMRSRRGAAEAARWAASVGRLTDAVAITASLAMAFRSPGEVEDYLGLLDDVQGAHTLPSAELVVVREEALAGLSKREPTALRELNLTELPLQLRMRAQRLISIHPTFGGNEQIEVAIALAEQVGDQHWLARILVDAAYHHLRRWEYDQAERALERARRAGEGRPASVEHARAEHARGRLALVRGRTDLALQCLERAHSIGATFASQEELAVIRIDFGRAHYSLGDIEAAKAVWSDSVHAAELAGAPGRAVDVQRMLGGLCHGQGDLAGATDHLCRGLHHALVLGLAAEESYLRLNLGLVALEQGEMRRAVADLERAADALATSGIPLVEGYVPWVRTLAMWALDPTHRPPTKAQTLFGRLVEVLIEGGAPPAEVLVDPQLTPDVALLGWVRRRAGAGGGMPVP